MSDDLYKRRTMEEKQEIKDALLSPTMSPAPGPGEPFQTSGRSEKRGVEYMQQQQNRLI